MTGAASTDGRVDDERSSTAKADPNPAARSAAGHIAPVDAALWGAALVRDVEPDADTRAAAEALGRGFDAAVALIRDVAASAVEQDLSPRYVVVQVDVATWRHVLEVAGRA